MDACGKNSPLTEIARGRAVPEPLADTSKKQMASVNGKRNWLARNLRTELPSEPVEHKRLM